MKTKFGGLPFYNFIPTSLCSIGEDGAPAGGGGGSTGSGSSSAAGGSAAVADGGGSSSAAAGAPTVSSPSVSPSTQGGTPPAGSPANTTPGSSDGEVSTPIDFDSLFGGTEPGPAEQALATAQPSPPAQGAQPQTPGTLATPAAGAEPAQPGTPGQPGSGTPTPTAEQGTSPTLSPANPLALAQALAQNEAAAIEHLASQFQLSEAETQALENDTYAALPKVMAKVAVKIQQQFFRNLAQIVPAMLDQHTRVSTRNKENEDAFFGAWPGLNRKDHGEAIKRIAQVYRAQNPQATREQMFQDVGLMVSMQYKVPLPQPGSHPAPNGNGAAGSPPIPKSQPSPWTPAGATPAMGGTPAEGSEFAFLGHHGD